MTAQLSKKFRRGHGYPVRLAGVYATRWRYPGEPGARIGDTELGIELAAFYRMFEDQGPYQLPDLLCRAAPAPNEMSFGVAGAVWSTESVTSAEVLVFTLPFPADQVVAALILTFNSPDLNADPALAMRLLTECMEATVAINGRDLADYVDGLLAGVGVEPVVPPGSRRPARMPLERHQLLFIRDLHDADSVRPDTVRRMLNGSRPPFSTLIEPAGLSEDGSYSAVGGRASFLCGHTADVENSVFLTTVQAVGTASRFQQIWQEAYYRVQEFQDKKQRKEIGVQQREDMAELADRMGNLELDLAFSVQTAADLGLNPSIRIDSFHDALYKVMQVEVRAKTVGQMFDRLGGSIRSELTAIESRERQDEEARRAALTARENHERQEEDKRRAAGALALGILSFIIAPVTFLLGFFGMNVSQVHNGQSMWMQTYLWAYIVAGLLAVIPLLTVLILRSRTKRRVRAARGSSRSRDPEVKQPTK
jgi:hypothetical protein